MLWKRKRNSFLQHFISGNGNVFPGNAFPFLWQFISAGLSVVNSAINDPAKIRRVNIRRGQIYPRINKSLTTIQGKQVISHTVAISLCLYHTVNSTSFFITPNVAPVLISHQVRPNLTLMLIFFVFYQVTSSYHTYS